MEALCFPLLCRGKLGDATEIVAMVSDVDDASDDIEEVQDGTDTARANVCVEGVQYELSWMASMPNPNARGGAVQIGDWRVLAEGAVVVTMFGEIMLRLGGTPLGPAASPGMSASNDRNPESA